MGRGKVVMVNTDSMPVIYTEECRKIRLWIQKSVVTPRENFYLKMENIAC